MKLDEFAFLNQQLAGMLRAGIPLEGALRQLSAQMRRGHLRNELEALREDLAQGAPFEDAIGRRQLPDLYVRLTQTGAKGGELPGIFTMLADYYDRLAGITTRLKGLMVYPLIVLCASLGVSLLITGIYRRMILDMFADAEWLGAGLPRLALLPGVWLPSGILLSLLVAWFLIIFTPAFRHWARWKLPGFREASIAQFSGAAALLLRSGATLQSALGLLQKAEERSPAGREVDRWISLHSQGQSKWNSFTAGSRVFPPLFIWLVAQGGEDLAGGFQRASEIYQSRSSHKIDLLLYAALPVSVLLLAGLIVGQIYPLVQTIRQFLNLL